MSTLSSLREALWVVTMLPEVLKRRSDGELVAQTDRYDCASLETWDSAFSTNTMDPPLGPTSELPHMHLVLL